MIEQEIKREALRLGFSAAGIAPAAALQNRRDDMLRWLQKGMAGPLGYMQEFFERQRRFLDGFPEARSLVVLAADYPIGATEREFDSPAGRIARYALAPDYHKVLRRRLKLLETTICGLSGGTPRIRKTIDTSAIQERVLAEAAGLGFFGKNNCLIRPKGGSFFFICALITDLALEPDPPPQRKWSCGSCTLCIEACPTGALTEPYNLDAARCVSSLTIEVKGPVPQQTRAGLKDWLFGCDICQEVCPYNRPERKPCAEDFPVILPEKLSLAGLLGCRSELEFKALFQGTALKRAGREGMVRNAAIAAGNSQDPVLVLGLADCLLHDASPVIRSHAAWALGRIDTADARKCLAEAAGREIDPTAKQEISQALAQTL